MQTQKAGGKTLWQEDRPPSSKPTSMEQGWRSIAAFLVLALWASGSSQGDTGNWGPYFSNKVAFLQKENLSYPKCFTEKMEELACFWETFSPTEEQNNQSTYTFGYKYGEDQYLTLCSLTVEYTPWNTTRYTCFFPRGDVSAFAPMEVKVFDGMNHTIYSRRDLYVERLILLDPPSNLTVQLLESSQLLNVSWLPPPVTNMDSNLHYEVSISPEGYETQRVETTIGQTYHLVNLKSGIRYTLAVRAKARGSYNGYWSVWSQSVSVVIPSDLDPFILTLSLILVLIVLFLTFIALLSKHRFLKQKMWPVIPSPEHEFKDLFTIYKGNFQLWMGQQSAYLWWSQNSPYLEEQPFLVEVLSDRDGWKGDGPHLPPPLPPKKCNMVELPQIPEVSQGDYLVLDEDLLPCCLGGDGTLLLPDSDGSEGPDPALGERTRSPEPSQTSSSFEYTVFDPSSESLCPQGHPQTEVQLKSSYQMVSDSGISADYSLAESSTGQISLYTNLCDGGPQLFQPAYIVCS
nr:erythropoietin receptor [Anolis sagrei ordinatus]